MGIFDSVTRLVTLPVEIVDKVVVKPVADALEVAAEELGVKERDQ